MSEVADWLSYTRPISRKNAAEAVFDDIRSAITSGRLAVGTRLPAESQLAGHYGVSRPIVREALRSLQTLGFTQTRTGSGTFVVTSTPSPELHYGGYSARDLIEARPFIEVPAAGWAALRRTDAQLARLLGLCDEMDRQEDPYKWVQLDSEFHSMIAEASGNAVFAKIVADARDALMRQSELVNMMAQRRVASNVEHRQIVEAILAGSEQAAIAAMEAHLGQVERVVTTIIGEDQPQR
ncbi:MULTISPECIES: FadR/GntR family transcriptional regulator [Rhizobium]|jgi:DNA-binding FadR family transcriptional regulator|uniref:FadR/GntR family transcriptional regulator n=1 Tax=Rhizobium TaxID=379 RepID=UPI0014454142|nr:MULTISPECIES: FadR/GntR family transcriptional regulator [Rhizobium]NKJ37781.1 DNA-binding FadR family transcriptional regulator [Rhizobium sp. SG570]NTJ10286.1 FadR family transcriptional regulator [Rhizobium lusitanum]